MLASANDQLDPRLLVVFARRTLLSELADAILDGDRLLVLTGPSGSGKTTMASVLEDDLVAQSWRVLRVQQWGDEPITLRAFACQLLGKRESEFAAEDIERLFAVMTTRDTSDGKMLVIVDDADRLSSDLREYLSLLCSVASQEMPPLLFLGTPSFWDTEGASVRSADFRKHIACRLQLEPLAESEVQAFVSTLLPHDVERPIADAVVRHGHNLLDRIDPIIEPPEAVSHQDDPQELTVAATTPGAARLDSARIELPLPSDGERETTEVAAAASVSPSTDRPTGNLRRLAPVVAVVAAVVASAPIYWLITDRHTESWSALRVRIAGIASEALRFGADLAVTARIAERSEPSTGPDLVAMSTDEQSAARPVADESPAFSEHGPDAAADGDRHDPSGAGFSPAAETVHAPDQPDTPPLTASVVSAGAAAEPPDGSADASPIASTPPEQELPTAQNDATDLGVAGGILADDLVPPLPQQRSDSEKHVEASVAIQTDDNNPLQRSNDPAPAPSGVVPASAAAPAGPVAQVMPPPDAPRINEIGRAVPAEPRAVQSTPAAAMGPANSVVQRPTVSPVPTAVASTESLALMSRGDAMLAVGDLSAARLLYRRAVSLGNARAATALGKTYDPAFLALVQATGIAGDPAQAAEWYRKGIALGDPEAINRLAGSQSGAEGKQ